MTSDSWDRQRDIEAEGQRAAIYHAKKAEGESLPQLRGANRLLGISPEGRPVDNVTAQNRYKVHESNPWIFVHLLNEDKSRILHGVYIPNTRERPDAVIFEGKVYEVVSTRIPTAQYREIMTLNAVTSPPETGDSK